VEVLPKFADMPVTQVTLEAFGGTVTYHRYVVPGVRCGTCAQCAPKRRRNGVTPKQGECIGLPSVTSITGKYAGGGLYPAGYRHALDAVFGAYTNKDKDELMEDSWMSDLVRSGFQSKSSIAHNRFRHYMNPEDILRFRQEVEEIPTPGDVSRDFGTGVHTGIESLLHGDGEVPSQYIDACQAILGWLNKGGADGPYVVEDVEVDVFHSTLLYGGQIDCVARCGNRVILIDWKSGKDIYPEHAMQIGAYGMAYEHMTGEAISEYWVVKSGRHGFEAKQVTDIAPAQKAFIALQETKKNVDEIKWTKDIDDGK